MTQWTDDEIVARLTASFTTHEADADPGTAQQIALAGPPAARRRWPAVLAAAAAVVLIAGLAAYAVQDRGTRTEPSATQTTGGVLPPGVTPAVAGTNRELAKAEAARLLADFPVPPGSTESDIAPVHRLTRRSGIYGGIFGESDRSLTVTRWWVVPLSYTALVGWYAAHTPANPGSTYSGLTTHVVTNGELGWQLSSKRPDAFSAPQDVVAYAQLSRDTTAIRTDVTLAARYDRVADTMTPESVTSIDITKSALDGPLRAPTTATVSDPAVAARVVTGFDRLDGDFAGTQHFACGSPAGIVYVYAVTLHWPGHVLTSDPGAALCGIGRGLTLDGVKLPQTLEDTLGFDHVLNAALIGP